MLLLLGTVTGGVRRDVRAFAACNAEGQTRLEGIVLREYAMFKVAAIAAFGLSLVVGAGNAVAVDAMPTGDFAHSGGGSGSAETETATAATRAAGSASAMHETARDADSAIAHEPILPESAAINSMDSTRATRGTDATSSSASTPSHKTRNNGHWQSLLPGVMK